MTESRRRLHNEKIHNLYVSVNITAMIKSIRMRWVGDVACMGEKRDSNKILVGKHREETVRKILA